MEAVRLVIWDLDETYWSGTLTEGGITYIQKNHDIVIELAKRGIISSICSKNDFNDVYKVLVEYKIADYFVFPSISWQPKGARIAQIVEDIQLRPETVIFIDDNPNNLAEVLNYVPGIRVQDQHFISSMLEHVHFKGKDDRDLTRLKQYQLLYQKKKDEVSHAGDSSDFLRKCDIQLLIEYDIEQHYERAIELINRTNQLNFTKNRLPEEKEAAKKILLDSIKGFNKQAGLIKVVDKYGDYGFTGFYLTRYSGNETTLEHFCFSCRTLGMGVEYWVYDHLKRPQLNVVGDVIVDIFENKKVDWITAGTGEKKVANVNEQYGEIRMYGGCEVNAIGHYLSDVSKNVSIEGNFSSGKFFFRKNALPLLLSAYESSNETLSEVSAEFGLEKNAFRTNFLKGINSDALLIYSADLDGGFSGYEHLKTGFKIKCEPDNFWESLISATNEEIENYCKTYSYTQSENESVKKFINVIKNNYQNFAHKVEDLEPLFSKFVSNIPNKSKLIIILPDHRIRDGNSISSRDWISEYCIKLENIVRKYNFIGAVKISDCILCEDEIHAGWNHYDRLVYIRLAEAIKLQAENINFKY